MACILQRVHGVRAAKDIRALLGRRMDLWIEGRYIALVTDIEEECLSATGGGAAKDDESTARDYNNRVLSGRIRSAVRALTNRRGGGVLQPDELCSKSGKTVLRVLRSKHPVMNKLPIEGFTRMAFKVYNLLHLEPP